MSRMRQLPHVTQLLQRISLQHEHNTAASLTELRFYVPPDTKHVSSETFFPANLLAKYWKTESTKANMHPQNKHEMNTHKSKAAFGRLLRPPAGNRMGLFLNK